MADNSAIEWTDATWNPVTGCAKITRGCDNRYAARFTERWRGVKGHPYEQGFDLRLWPERLDQPTRWKRRRRRVRPRGKPAKACFPPNGRRSVRVDGPDETQAVTSVGPAG